MVIIFLVESYMRGRVSLGASWRGRRETIAVFTFSLYSLLPLITLSMWTIIFCLSYSWHTAAPMALYLVWACALDSSATSGRRTPWLRKYAWWHYYADFFPISLVKTADLDPSQTYVMGYHPHGIISVGAFSAFATEGAHCLDMTPHATATRGKRGFSSLFPGVHTRLVTLPINFRTPLLREYILSLGCVNSAAATFRSVLRQGPGSALVVVVGGAEESLSTIEGGMHLVLERRKGFVREAIAAGACLVPILAYGENDVYRVFESAPDSAVGRLQAVLKRTVGFTVHIQGSHSARTLSTAAVWVLSPLWRVHWRVLQVPMFRGRSIFFKNAGLLPRRCPITCVVGAPLPPPPRASNAPPFRPKFERGDAGSAPVPLNDDARTLEAHHQKYVEALKALYHVTKSQPWNAPGLARNESLRIVG